MTNEKGVTMLEYALLMALVATVAIAVVTFVGSDVESGPRPIVQAEATTETNVTRYPGMTVKKLGSVTRSNVYQLTTKRHHCILVQNDWDYLVALQCHFDSRGVKDD